MQQMNLGDLPLNQTGVVKHFLRHNTLTDRIISLGITEGAEITAAFRSPFGDPTAYFVKGCLIALRKSDCEHITVLPKGE